MNHTLNIKKNNKNSLCILLNGKKYEVNSQWLYEHSDNTEIRDPYTKQLLIEAAEISPSLKIIDAQIKKETLAITFSDNSQHKYKINYIYSQLKKAPLSDDKYLWNKKNLKVPKYNFKNINNPSIKTLFDLATIYKNSKNYEKAIELYTTIMSVVEKDTLNYADLLYRRGGSFERLGEYEKSDKDLLEALKIIPNNSYVLNYLAYSWLERGQNINKAILMLEKAYKENENDPYIIDSVGWGYFLVGKYNDAEKYMRRAIELMPNDPIVNDHYGDILWKMNRKIQARYFWKSVLKMNDTEKEMVDSIKEKLIKGLPKKKNNESL